MQTKILPCARECLIRELRRNYPITCRTTWCLLQLAYSPVFHVPARSRSTCTAGFTFSSQLLGSFIPHRMYGTSNFAAPFHFPLLISACTGTVSSCSLPCSRKTPCNCTSELPEAATFPSTIVGRNTASGYFALSSTTLCIFSSREPLPLSPLVANTTISPLAFPVSESKCSAPLFTLKVQCTVCRELSTVKCTFDWAGSTTRRNCEERAAV